MTVMKRAWEIAKAAVKNFGGKAREYMSEALKMAWAEFKKVAIIDRIAELEAVGFKRWTKNGMDRLYINAGALGLVCQYYKTGNIMDAKFNGEQISNSEGYRMKAAKTYIDIKTETVHSDNTKLREAAAELAKLA